MKQYSLTLKVSQPVVNILEIKHIAGRLKERLANDMQAVALAAPQLGENVRMFIMRPNLIFINPEIVANSGKQITSQEGCCSLLEEGFVDVQRFTSVQVRYMSMEGNTVLRTYHGHEACIIQHEIDHLDGKMLGRTYTDVS